jgi:hypothetical protein
MSETTQNLVPAPLDALHAELRALIASSRQRLAQEFGWGFESCNLRRMVKFAESFPNAAIVSTLSTQLS